MPRLAKKASRGRKRGGRAASKLYIERAVMVRPVGKAKVVVAPVAKPWGLTPEPAPVTKAVPSSSSLASWVRRRNSASSEGQSSPTSIEKGTSMWALVTVTEGWTSGVALSVASVASATRVAATAGEVTPCQVLDPLVVTRRARARAGLTTEWEVGVI